MGMSAGTVPGPHIDHNRLFTETGLKLGKILWYLLKANQDLVRKAHVKEPSSNGIGWQSVVTEFGEDVGKDEIYWWVYKKEKDLEALHERVKRTLAFVQLLKDDSVKLEPAGVQTYTDLVTVLTTFIETHQHAIEGLYEFVLWLHERDFLAPAILFTYRVWGTSRKSDRWLDLNDISIDVESTTIIKALTEIVCGVRYRLGFTRLFEKMAIDSELYESDPENYRARSIPEHLVASKTANKALKEFSIFFEEVRDSLRNIELDIEKYIAESNLLKSESFWKRFITKATSLGRIESVLWDFKKSLEMWHTTKDERPKAQKDFCKRVAAFANREGGAIIIGVTNDTWEVVGIADLENKVKSISLSIQRWLDYPRKDAIFHLQPVPFEKDGNILMCLVVAVAQTENAVGVTGLSGEYYYPYRDQTGVVYLKPRDLNARKLHLKAGDNFGFTKELQAFLNDK